MDHIDVERGFSKRSVESYKDDLKKFFSFLACEQKAAVKDVDISTVRVRDIRKYLRWGKDKGNSNSTLNRRLVVLRAFFRFHCGDEGVLDKDPTRSLRNLKTERRLPVYLTLEECEDLLSFVKKEGVWPKRDYCILQVFLQCGCRSSELSGLRLKDVLYEENLIRFYGKGRKERLVPLLETTISAIKDYLEERKPEKPGTDSLFLTMKGRPLTNGGLKQVFKDIVSRWPRSKPGLSLHKLRHSCMTLLLRNGVDLRSIQEIAGHASIATTEIYTHVAKDDLMERMQKHPLG